ncbi:NACHT, LRR and PYD domains-containing protein 2 [Pteronotus mesoamericanus]|uniref:NACHT, LRR and PYD domains-containing protein 2 n=1 Tax=Pteronotus mesoamericanus TaxID=1884717 RepID=UPI0023ED153A|nr:NACHT, LRR and PYD domains-containing protein 2 [Pteronotus parnellii mesoamericanus]
MVPSAELGFNLRPLLEQLNQDELSKLKSLLRTLSPQDELQHIPQTEVEEANWEQLAEILATRCPRRWVEMVTIQALEKISRTDLSKRAKDELQGLTQVPGEGVTNPEEVKERLEGEKPGEKDEHRRAVETSRQVWKEHCWPKIRPPVFTQRGERLRPFCNPKMLPGPFPQTLVLHGPAGVGKTTLAKKWMLEWRQDSLSKTLQSAFYLSCKALTRQGTCTFAELIAKSRPEVREAEVLAQAQNVLFVVDGFEELRVPSGSLIHDICGDWKKQKPVPVLLGSLLKRKLLPKATLLVTTRPGALRELRLLAEQPVLLEVEGLSELGRRQYFLRHFGAGAQALRAFEAMRSSPALFRLGSAPAVCWAVCTCLRRQLEQGEDPAAACRTGTALFLRFLCGQVAPAAARGPLPAALRAASALAAAGLRAQTSALQAGDLERLGLKGSALRPFLDKGIVQEDADCEGCYAFVHLSVQQFLAAVFYVLDGEGREDAGRRAPDLGDLRALLSREARLRNPDLTAVGYFLFGLCNERRARELEATFGCRVSARVKRELLASLSGAGAPFSWTADLREVLHCLYESQEGSLVEEATAHVRELSLHLRNEVDLAHSSFCLQHCQHLQKVSLQVAKGVFVESGRASGSGSWVERSQNDQHVLSLWMDLCSVFDSNKNLVYLDISQSSLDSPSVRILCERIASAPCNLQKVVLRNISPADAYRNFCTRFGGYETLTHLTLEGNDQHDMLPTLCEVLRHPKCKLQYLRLVSCSATAQQWAELSCCLETNQSLTCLNLTANELLDEGARLLYLTLRYPKCFLQRLSLENCHFTGAYCKELSSALIVNQRLTHLCLAKNDLGDGGVKLLCEGLSYPDCQLQTLVLYYCNITCDGCINLSMLLQQNSSLTHLDLGLNHIGVTGLKFLCEALKKPLCNLRCLWLWGCAITAFSCANLSSALSSNQNLVTLDLGQNPVGYSGVKMLYDVLKLPSCPLQKLRLKIDKSDAQTQKLLKEIKESNPKLTIERDDQEPKNNRPSSQDFIF